MKAVQSGEIWQAAQQPRNRGSRAGQVPEFAIRSSNWPSLQELCKQHVGLECVSAFTSTVTCTREQGGDGVAFTVAQHNSSAQSRAVGDACRRSRPKSGRSARQCLTEQKALVFGQRHLAFPIRRRNTNVYHITAGSLLRLSKIARSSNPIDQITHDCSVVACPPDLELH